MADDFKRDDVGDQDKDTETFSGLIKRSIEEARDFQESVFAPGRREATKRYRRDPYGDEQEGRSQYLASDLSDSVGALLPSLCRLFFGPERVVEYRPNKPEAVQQAEQATQYICDVVLEQDNPGFLLFYSWFKDAMIRKYGVVKWRVETNTVVTDQTMRGLPPEALALLRDVPEATILSEEAAADGAWDVKVRVTRKDKRVRVETLPHEEFLFSPNARSLEDATMVAHICRKTRSELLDMGVSVEDLDEYGSEGDQSLELTADAVTRIGYLRTFPVLEGSDAEEESQEGILYAEVYIKHAEGDDADENEEVAQLHKVVTIGGAHHIISDELVDQRPFAVLVCDPEPHTFVEGLSVADKSMDLQRLRTVLTRAILDSSAASIFPRTGYVDGEVSVADLMNTGIGAPIRMNAPGMIQPIVTPFIGAQLTPLLALVDEIKENRLGISKAAAGLNPDALQSSTKAAVAATVTASQQQIELMGRLFAETGVKALMRGLLRAVIEAADEPRMARLRGREFVQFDPRGWDASMDVDVNVAIGLASTDDRVATLREVLGHQQQLLETLGPENPIVDLPRFRRTLAKLLELKGFKNVDQFYKPISDDWQAPPPPPQAEQPNAEMELVKVEAARAQADAQIAMQKLQLESQGKVQELQLKLREQEIKIADRTAELKLREQEMMNRDDLERDKLDAEVRLRAADIEGKSGLAVNVAQIRAELERDRHVDKMALEHRKLGLDATGKPPRRRLKVVRDQAGNLAGVEEEQIDDTGQQAQEMST